MVHLDAERSQLSGDWLICLLAFFSVQLRLEGFVCSLNFLRCPSVFFDGEINSVIFVLTYLFYSQALEDAKGLCEGDSSFVLFWLFVIIWLAFSSGCIIRTDERERPRLKGNK